MATVDVTIRGAGVFGLSIGWACVRRGARVRLVDPRGPGGGASGGIVGALAPHAPDAWTPLKAFQLGALLAAEPFWNEVEAVSGVETGYARTGRLQPIADAAALARAEDRAREAEAHWGGAARWAVVEAAAHRGWAPSSPSGWLVEDTLSARINPRRACESLAAAIRARGGEVVREADDAGAVVHATGWEGLRALEAVAGRPVGGGVKGQAVLLRHRVPPGAPQIYAPGLHVVPHADGTVAIGSTSERDFEDGTATDAQTDELRERAVALVPILHGASVIRRWAGVRPKTRSRLPMLGAWPGRPGHFIANGGFKIGFGLAPEVARLMADLVIEGTDAIPPEFRADAVL